MRLLDHTYPSPAENLACDEALLDALDTGEGSPTLRFWESTTHFVVVGYANKLATEVNLETCHKLNIPILRRTSGGGTVVQGPGCLNYALILPIDSETAGITETNCHIMSRHRDALTQLLNQQVKIQGHTDLTVPLSWGRGARGEGEREGEQWLKFSGNAQRRKRHALLFHGCFLLHFNLSLIDQLLLHPTKEPDYRNHRSHQQFLTNLNIGSAQIKKELASAWNANELAKPPNLDPRKYEDTEWNEKF